MDASEPSFCGLLQRKSPLRKANLKILQGGTSLQAPPSAPRHCSLWPKGVKVNRAFCTQLDSCHSQRNSRENRKAIITENIHRLRIVCLLDLNCASQVPGLSFLPPKCPPRLSRTLVCAERETSYLSFFPLCPLQFVLTFINAFT